LFWLNLMTDVFPALGLAMARPAADIFERPPRAASEDVFGRRELSSIGREALGIAAPAILTHVLATMRYRTGPRTRGLTFLSLASRQLAHALRLRPGRPASELLDRPIELGVLAGYALLAAPFAVPPLRRALRIAAPRPLEAILIIALSLAPLALRILSPRRVQRDF
jgi:Ca2+-transporting ATPase